jgi:hypothetical protein
MKQATWTGLFSILRKRRYELLLAALLLHLFIGILLPGTQLYMEVVLPINMLIIGFCATGFFVREKGTRILPFVLFALVVASPFVVSAVRDIPLWMFVTSMLYILYFLIILREVFAFLIKPGYINSDLISAAACGYLLLLETSSFLMQGIYYLDNSSFKGIDNKVTSTIFMDFVYFSSEVLTSIGFGDILPTSHHTRLLTSLFGIAGQFYTVVLVGIIISKFSSNHFPEKEGKADPENGDQPKNSTNPDSRS